MGQLEEMHGGWTMSAWVWPVGVLAAVVLLFVVLFRLSTSVEPDEQKRDGEKWWGGGE